MFDRGSRRTDTSGIPLEDRSVTTRIDSDSPCWVCGAVELDCTCAREFEATTDLVQTFGTSDIMVVATEFEWEWI